MYLTEQLEEKWKDVLDHPALSNIKDPYKRAVTAVVLENQEQAIAEERRMLNEAAPTNSGGGLGAGTNIGSYDPILISLVRRALPNLIAYDVCGVQPMTGPTGLIFAMRSKYRAMNGTEALFNEANSGFSGTNALCANGNNWGSLSNTNPVFSLSESDTYGVGRGMTTAQAEALGDVSTNQFQEMAFAIGKVS